MLFLMYTNGMISDTFKGAFFSSCVSSSRRLQLIPRSAAESKKPVPALQAAALGRFARGRQPREERAVRPEHGDLWKQHRALRRNGTAMLLSYMKGFINSQLPLQPRRGV